MNKHNFRDSQGRFTYYPGKKSINFRPSNVVNGRLYKWKGIVVRAKSLTNNNLRVISYHKLLNGFVRDSELELINKSEVEDYLKNSE